ncbi:hypothetical protein MO867_12455 [Microbulbifer sp. OS29]|uniref:Uncharacterized protein n=1 Tax=Microbulbifer okhotskensis TaxID=2926617 RepID=A0A9X2J5F1_9GAMM|nr:hypothetical protein [Microbulbifer okhotskensis]MCO1335143.1 hypothetical protein [Microbulbifer okhotskensis]
MSIDTDQLIANIKDAASSVISHDIAGIRGFSDRQLSALALQAKLISQAILSGEISGELRDYFLDSLEDMARNFANTLRGLMTVTIEKIWNAVVGVIWGTIETCTGISLKLET